MCKPGRNNLFFILIPLLCFASNCKKIDTPVKPKEWKVYGPFLLDTLADYVFFKAGTTWVYKNPANGILDTVEILSSQRWVDTLIDTDKAIKEIRESFFMGFTFSKDGYTGTFRDQIYPPATDQSHGKAHFMHFAKYKSGYPGGSMRVLFYPFEKKYNWPYTLGFESIQLLHKDTAVVVNGRHFNSVQVFQNTRDFTWGNWPAVYYWAPHFGIIYRKNLETNEEWVLESETILQ